MYAWIHQHVLGHHSYTNIDGADPDIVTAAAVRVEPTSSPKLLLIFLNL